MAKQYNRQFNYKNPFIINGKEFPTTLFSVEDNENNINQMRVGTNAQGEYFTLFDDKIQPVMLQDYVPEVTATGSKEKFRKKVMEEARKNLEKETNDYLTGSNDNTMVLDVPHATYNTHSEAKAIKGGADHALQDTEHPDAALARDVATAFPFILPLLLSGGVGIGGIVNAGLDLYGLAHGYRAIKNGDFNALTTLDFLPLTKVAKWGYDLAKNGFQYLPKLNTLNAEVKQIPKGTAVEPKYNIDLYDKYLAKTDPRLLREDEIPLFMREERANNYLNFVGSKNYQQRFKKSGLSDDHYNYMLDTADRRLNDGNFPSNVAEIVDDEGNDIAFGLSRNDPEDPFYGITLSPKQAEWDTDMTLNHEMSHWATGNVEPYHNINTKYADWTGNPEVSKMIDIMKYNESLVPNRISFDEFSKKILRDYPDRKLTPEELKYYYKEFNDIQEMRAEAYAVIQEAKNEGKSIDEYINANLTKEGNGIKNIASDQLIRLGRVLNVNDLKKFIKSFLSVAAPIGITTPFINSNNNSTSK